MRPIPIIAVLMFVMQGLAAAGASGQSASDPTRSTIDVPRRDVVMGEDIGHTDWSTRLAKPSDEGQFEVLVRKSATDIQAPDCRSDYLVIRMPASVSIGADPATQAAVARKRQYYRQLLTAYQKGQALHAEVFAGPYGKRGPDGALVLTQCNLFFVPPAQSH